MMRRGEACFQSVVRARRARLANDLAALVLVLAGLAGFGVFLVSAFFWSAWVLLALVPAFGYLAFRWLSGLSTNGLARRIEECFVEVKGKLVPALELAEYQSASKEGYSAELVDAAVREVDGRVKELALSRVVDRRRVALGAAALVVGLGLFLGYHGVFPARSRLGLLNAFEPGSVPVEFFVEPGDTALLPGGEVVLRCRVEPAGVFREVVFERGDLGHNPKPQEGFGYVPRQPVMSHAEQRRVALKEGSGQVALRPQDGFDYRFRVLSIASSQHLSLIHI